MDDKSIKKDTFTDNRDGKTYKTIKIGALVWFAENLNFEAEGSKCYDNNPANCEKYGRLYNWETALKACPKGWRLPSNEEWATLVDYAGGEEKAAKKLKAAKGWNQDGNGTDEYGFSALPGGGGYSGGAFYRAGNHGIWWSATEKTADNALGWGVSYSNEGVYKGGNLKTSLFSVRCVQD